MGDLATFFHLKDQGEELLAGIDASSDSIAGIRPLPPPLLAKKKEGPHERHRFTGTPALLNLRQADKQLDKAKRTVENSGIRSGNSQPVRMAPRHTASELTSDSSNPLLKYFIDKSMVSEISDEKLELVDSLFDGDRHQKAASMNPGQSEARKLMPSSYETEQAAKRRRANAEPQHPMTEWRLGYGFYQDDSLSESMSSGRASRFVVEPTVSAVIPAPSVISAPYSESGEGLGFGDESRATGLMEDKSGDAAVQGRGRQPQPEPVSRSPVEDLDLDLDMSFEREERESVSQSLLQERRRLSNANDGKRDKDNDLAPLAPQEPAQPRVWKVPIKDIPPLEFSDEGEIPVISDSGGSDSEGGESDAGSVLDMIVEDSDAESEDSAFFLDTTGRIDTESDDDSDEYQDKDESDNELDPEWHATTRKIIEVAERAREQQSKRPRIAAVKWWLNERVEYDMNSPLFLPTAVDVVHVEPREAERKRRRRKRRMRLPVDSLPLEEEDIAGPDEVQVPLYDGDSTKAHEEPVAWSIRGLPFEALPNNPRVQVVVLFDTPEGVPVESLVMRVQPGGQIEQEMVHNRTFTFVVWSGKCTVTVNGESFDLIRGMACRVPPGNELKIQNTDDTDVHLLVNEISTPEVGSEAEPDQPSIMGAGMTTRSIASSTHWSRIFH